MKWERAETLDFCGRQSAPTEPLSFIEFQRFKPNEALAGTSDYSIHPRHFTPLRLYGFSPGRNTLRLITKTTSYPHPTLSKDQERARTCMNSPYNQVPRLTMPDGASKWGVTRFKPCTA
ncbi:predicted protein [Sclerotinia sclerotiorum 1980 UF-70]|uniref:Uncharacterized protein n=1 Tax=Sclerotinia sclerotiorum (strain ATCC 18683 / 1980 / Ss-1) TaxID=665079 RepID=A7ETU1_SCLS1|nr:predicted protein [Sclerotinia sclerotiorum 1980 UF-70]EDN92883.1 predicted protein [Sclerotinia sclerotiorum 1980 UF-70]